MAITLNERKQLDQLVCDELNIKQLARNFGITEKGDIILYYDTTLKDYKCTLGDETIPIPKTLLKLICERK